jgi:capsule biosynthesis phosphatase
MSKVIYDIDNTLTANESNCSYEDKPVNFFLTPGHLNKLKNHEIAYYSARNMRTYKENLDLLEHKTKPLISKWLVSNGYKQKEAYVGKPYCGEDGIYVDDRAINLRSHILSIDSDLINQKIFFIVVLFNADAYLDDLVLQFIEIITLSPLSRVLFVNNASSDGTKARLHQICDSYPFIYSVSLRNNKGYGGAVKKGITTFKETTQFENFNLVISHGNAKFSILDFVKGIAENKKVHSVVYTRRCNRKLISRFITLVLYVLFIFRRSLEIHDCIGASRYIPKAIFQTINFENAPDDYTLDIWLACKMKDTGAGLVVLPEKNLINHTSSWNKSFWSKFSIIWAYLKFLFKF